MTATHTSGGPAAPPAHPIAAFAWRLHEVLDEVTAASASGLAAREAGEAAVRLARAEARLAALRLRLLDEAHRGDVGEASASTTAGWWAQAATVDRPRARREVALAGWLTSQFARTDVALAAGAVSAPQAEVVVDAVRALPASVGPGGREKAEQHLLEQAAHFGPKELKILGRRLLDVIDPDAAESRLAARLEAEEVAASRRCFLEMHDDGEGTTRGRFAMPTLAGDMFRTALNAFASPRRPDGYERETTGGEQVPDAELAGQAFIEMIERYPADRIPQSGGVNATVIVTIPVDTLLGGLESADLLTGHQLSPGEARRLACEASILPQVLGGGSHLLDYGRERRFHTTGQRRVIHSRDKTCRAEGCDIPANWCHVHHLTPWSLGGRTSVDDAVALCSRHHTAAHHPGYATNRTIDGQLRFTRMRHQRAPGEGGSSLDRVTTLPDVISRYYAASSSSDLDSLLACFAADAHVRDEGRDHDGLDAIRGWRESVATRYTYTTEITDVEQVGEHTYVVHTHLEGDFPGGVVDLAQRFQVTDGLITDLEI